MSIWAIADIHASRTDQQSGQPAKPMDLFGPSWTNHMERLEVAWHEVVRPPDTVIVAGDTEWALHVEEARETLTRLDGWPGRKILVRGNHDFWWSSKTTNKVRKVLPPSLSLLHNDSRQAEGFNICGAKGSPVPGGIDWTEENAKLLNRERERLLLSLQARDPMLPTIVALHFPPFYPAHGGSLYREMIEQHEVRACVYGHLHGAAASAGPLGRHDGTQYYLVAGDAVGFRPVLIARNGEIVPATHAGAPQA